MLNGVLLPLLALIWIHQHQAQIGNLGVLLGLKDLLVQDSALERQLCLPKLPYHTLTQMNARLDHFWLSNLATLRI